MENSVDVFNDDFFIPRGFTHVGNKYYQKEIIAQRVQTPDGQLHEQRTNIAFKVYQYDETLGHNIEFYENGKVSLSGYWWDVKDFLSTFKF